MFLYVVLLLLGFLYLYARGSKRRKFARQIGGPYFSGYPILGNTMDFLRNMDKTLITLSNWCDQYGERFCFTFGPVVVFVSTLVDDMETILTSQNIIDKSEEYDLVKDWLGEGLITSTGTHWSGRRKLITPTFHFSILERFLGPINTQAKILVKRLKENFIDSENLVFKDITPYVALCALDIICETSMGKRLNAQSQGSNPYVEAVHRMGELFQFRSIRPWLRLKYLWKLTKEGREENKCLEIIHSFTDEVVKDRKKLNKMKAEAVKEESEKGKSRLALLDLILNSQESDEGEPTISDAGLREECTTFIFAGHDTITAAISFCLLNIGNDLKVQAKLQQELDAIFHDDIDREITMADVKELKYLECCIKESLRLFPSVPLIGRETKEDFKLDDNTLIPSGVAVFIFPYKLHRNSKYFPRPNEYIPERFEEGSPLKHGNPFMYVPFSAGPRNCIGQKLAMIEAKVVLAYILRKFTVESEMKMEDVELLSEIVLRARGGVKIKLKER